MNQVDRIPKSHILRFTGYHGSGNDEHDSTGFHSEVFAEHLAPNLEDRCRDRDHRLVT